VQVIDAPRPPALELTDLSGLAAGRANDRLLAFIFDTEAARPFRLSAGRCCAPSCSASAPRGHPARRRPPHVFDGWSAGVLLRELAALIRHATCPSFRPVRADYPEWET